MFKVKEKKDSKPIIMKNFYQLNDKIRKKIDFDIVIIGAGLSGLSLAIEISKRTKFSVLLLEKKRKLQKDKKTGAFGTTQKISLRRSIIIHGKILKFLRIEKKY